MASHRWYWAPTRVLAETPGVEGNAITEMPWFTFLYGDLHAHMISMPLQLFVMLFVWHEVRMAGRDGRSARLRWLALGLGALAAGMLRATNTWDWPTYTLLGIVGLGWAWWLKLATHLPAFGAGAVGAYWWVPPRRRPVRASLHLLVHHGLQQRPSVAGRSHAAMGVAGYPRPLCFPVAFIAAVGYGALVPRNNVRQLRGQGRLLAWLGVALLAVMVLAMVLAMAGWQAALPVLQCCCGAPSSCCGRRRRARCS